MSWIFFTLGAVIMQTFRNALQSKLSATVSTSGVTLARFLFAPPIALLYLFLLYFFSDQVLPDFSFKFIGIVILASVLQIAATSLMVILFKQKNFAVGAGLAKSEALVAGVIGTLFFGSQLSLFGWIGIFVGAAAVFVLSGGGKKGELSIKTILIGLACGTCFALTSLYVREAAHLLDVPFPHSAAWVLLWVLCIQTSLLIIYIAMNNPQTFGHLKQNAKMTFSTSLTSCLGSICWFSAMALHHVAYVKTLGQLEVLFTIVIAVFWLKNPVKKHEIIGLLLIGFAALLVMWA
ncbi:DMT family transporter [Paraglaciecola aquimarina]|uniref:DMT family transporter n=1 Tax=Paraglaciecola algarum TaxID=3050085 RepID=A0ABS9D9P2_9ALTE|nr:DMT family transporter [Paraglaciecola sp. G1-23]MCF2949095.1 DMT family transporter [Paraglaciecola sp. G1-23]